MIEPPTTPSNLNHQDPTSPVAAVTPLANRNTKPLPSAISLFQPGTYFDVAMQLSTLDDEEAKANPMRVLQGEEGLPGTVIEGIKWKNEAWEEVWETNWDVPAVCLPHSHLCELNTD